MSSIKDIYEGVANWPKSLGMIITSSLIIIEAVEYVVPKSIPKVNFLLSIIFLIFSGREL